MSRRNNKKQSTLHAFDTPVEELFEDDEDLDILEFDDYHSRRSQIKAIERHENRKITYD